MRLWQDPRVATRQLRPARLSAPGRYAASKVPRITVLFWVVKILTTAMGEAAADFLAFRYGPLIAGAWAAWSSPSPWCCSSGPAATGPGSTGSR